MEREASPFFGVFFCFGAKKRKNVFLLFLCFSLSRSPLHSYRFFCFRSLPMWTKRERKRKEKKKKDE